MTNILETKDLTVTFGGLNACDHVYLEIPAGKFVGLIGPNGAGKTTFIDAVTGYVTTSAGSVIFDEKDIGELKPHERARSGGLHRRHPRHRAGRPARELLAGRWQLDRSPALLHHPRR